MKGYLQVFLGAVPRDEAEAQPGEPQWVERAYQQCQQYLELVRNKVGPEPAGAELRVKSYFSDTGGYYELVCCYEAGNREAMQYALLCEAQAPRRWDD